MSLLPGAVAGSRLAADEQADGRAAHNRRRLVRRDLGFATMTVPALVSFFFFTIGPLIAVFYVSFTDWQGILSRPKLVGWKNYAKVFSDPTFWGAGQVTAIQVLVLVPVLTVLSFMLGYFVSLKPRFGGLLKVILFIPALISLPVKSMFFIAILAPTGILNGLLTSVGLGDWTTAWLANPQTALAWVILVDLWQGIGFNAVLFSARLGAIDPETFAAAELDGAGHWQRMWLIAYPISKSYFGVMAMLQFLWTLFGSAATILLLTNGGPDRATTTWSFLLYYKAFLSYQIGYSQAVGVVLIAVGLAGMAVILRLFRQDY
ncbi:MAG: sugar ABC transporter permease [Actinobacteria bacterium]|nr:sugar ABC transporter permease [Actinomycetota bacterium]